MGERIAYQIRLQRELARALARGQLRVVLQPIMDDARQPQVAGFEALLRWQHPELGEVPPVQFIPVAEESGLIVPIGEFVLRESCRLKAVLDAAGHGHLFLSVNVSRDQFRHGGLPAQVAQAITSSGVDGARLELEITESALLEQSDLGADQLEALASLGVGLSIDDFGTGYSSLSYLHRFPLTKLKIDRSFVMRLPGDRGAAEIVRSILTLARSLGLDTLAEGVETEAQQQLLLGLGCDQFQGYLYSRPLEADEVLGWLQSRN
jgi:diguanylate cyclase